MSLRIVTNWAVEDRNGLVLGHVRSHNDDELVFYPESDIGLTLEELKELVSEMSKLEEEE